MSGCVSIYDPTLGYELLGDSSLSSFIIYSASLLDIALGVWVLSAVKATWAAWVQAAVIVSYTILLTLIAPVYWLHPFGVLTKNIPIMVLIFYTLQPAKLGTC